MVTQDAVLAYARAVRQQKPTMESDELRAILEARFIDGKDPLKDSETLSFGVVSNPIDWIRGLSRIFAGLEKWFARRYINGIEDIIRGVLIIVLDGARNDPRK